MISNIAFDSGTSRTYYFLEDKHAYMHIIWMILLYLLTEHVFGCSRWLFHTYVHHAVGMLIAHEANIRIGDRGCFTIRRKMFRHTKCSHYFGKDKEKDTE